MKRGSGGFTLIELLVAIVLSVFVVEIAWKMLGDQKSNMVGIRQRLRAQAVAREALKTMEGEIRIAGFGQRFLFQAGSQGRVDSLGGAAALTTCAGLLDANGSSVSVNDGAAGYNDTLTLSYPMAVSPTTGTDCSQIQWSRYYLDASSNLIRKVAATLTGLGTSTSTSIVAKGVDVFQVRLGVMGGGLAPTSLLNPTTEACCAVLSAWNSTSATQVAQGTSIKVSPSTSSTWSFLSATKSLKAGERWRDTVFLEPNAAFFNDVHAKGATLTAGIYQITGAAVATVNLMTMPATDSSLSAMGSGLTYSFDLVVPTDGSYKLGLVGTSKTTASTALRIQTMNANRVGLAPGTSWWKDPADMALSEWAGVKELEIIILSRSESMDDAKAATFTGLANFVQGTGPVGEFTANDKQVRAVFDHIYPVGNNGAN